MSPISSPSDPVPDSQATRASEVAAAGLDLGRGGSSATAASPPGGALGPQGEISGFEFGEAEVAEVSGLAAKFLTAIRHKNLRQGDHWNLVGLRVAYNRAGLELLMEKATGGTGNNASIAIKSRLNQNKHLTNGRDMVAGRVSRFFLNPRLIEAKLPDGRRVRVRVRETKNFELGMEVPLLHIVGDVYELGRKCPRFPGRW